MGKSHFVLGVAVGTFGVCLCQWFYLWQLGLDIRDFLPGATTGRWWIALTMAIQMSVPVVPGLFAGFISISRGFAVGALAGALGSLLYGLIHALILVHVQWHGFNAHFWDTVLIFPTSHAIGLIITTAVGGGAGQLLRSNYRWSGRDHE